MTRFELAISEYGLNYGDRSLSSGQKSDVFVDVTRCCFKERFMLEWNKVVLDYLFEDSEEIDFDTVCGIMTGGALLGMSVTLCLQTNGFMVEGSIYNPKSGGVTGTVVSGGKVLLVEDVMTTGNTIIKAKTTLENMGAEVVGVLVAVSRAEEVLKPFDYHPFTHLERLQWKT